MEFRELIFWKKFERAMLRSEVRKPYFFENVTFQRPKYRKYIKSFFKKLETGTEIRIGKFTNLFSKIDKIVFPIKVQYVSTNLRYMDILDIKGNRYFIEFEEIWNIYSKNALKYIVWQEIRLNDKTLVQKEEYEIRLKEIETKGFEISILGHDKRSCIQYENVTTAILINGDENLTIVYLSRNEKDDKEIMDYLFSLENIEYDNLRQLFSEFVQKFKKKKDIVSMNGKVGNRICSEIVVEDELVTTYSYTKKEKENEICFHTIFCTENIEEFLK